MSQKPTAKLRQVSDIDLRLLRIFKSVVECGGFSAAEVELNISRAAISIAMADLEKRLALRLCQRGRSGFSLTEEGVQVHEAALQLLASLETFRTRVNTVHKCLKGELNIGITDNLVTMAHMRISNALAALKEKGPDVVINIRMIPPNEIERGVLEGALHLGVIPELRPLPGLEYYPLYEEASQLFCGRNHPLFDTPDGAIDQAALQCCDAVVPAYAQTSQIKALHQELNASATATDREGVAFLILTGRYIGYLPTHFAQRWLNEGVMRPLLPERRHYVTHYSVITRKGLTSNLVLDTYLAELARTEASVNTSSRLVCAD